VRNLERELAGVFRKLAREAIKNGKQPFEVDQKRVMKLLGVAKVPKDKNEKENQLGMVNGLAWTEFGGEVLVTEATTMPGKGKLIVTGVLRDVMKESAQAAVTYVRSKARRFGIEDKFFEQNDMHIHFPGAFPKDGPSAGVTMATALVSAITRIPVRRDVAMTGEITLRGRVTPIGGLKEKCLAAHRLGIKTVIVPRDNKKDLREVPKKVRKQLRIVLVDYVDEVLREALVLEKPAEFARVLPTDGGAAPAAM
jgi:ATP-dependent Lon protease